MKTTKRRSTTTTLTWRTCAPRSRASTSASSGQSFFSWLPTLLNFAPRALGSLPDQLTQAFDSRRLATLCAKLNEFYLSSLYEMLDRLRWHPQRLPGVFHREGQWLDGAYGRLV